MEKNPFGGGGGVIWGVMKRWLGDMNYERGGWVV